MNVQAAGFHIICVQAEFWSRIGFQRIFDAPINYSTEPPRINQSGGVCSVYLWTKQFTNYNGTVIDMIMGLKYNFKHVYTSRCTVVYLDFLNVLV